MGVLQRSRDEAAKYVLGLKLYHIQPRYDAFIKTSIPQNTNLDNLAVLGAALLNITIVLGAEPLIVVNRTVSDPITDSSEPTLIGVPLIVVLGPSLLKVTPSTAISSPCSTVNTWPSVVMIVGVGICRRIVLVSISREPEGFNEMSLLFTVVLAPPADKIASAIGNLVGFAEKVSPPTVKVEDWGISARVVVVYSTINTPDGPRLTVVLSLIL